MINFFQVVRSLAQLYGDSDPSQITVRSIDINQDNQAIFTWTNDSVPRSSECPKDEINKLLHVSIERIKIKSLKIIKQNN